MQAVSIKEMKYMEQKNGNSSTIKWDPDVIY